MGGIPGIGGASTSRASANYWESQGVGITDYAVSASGTDTIIIKNNQRNAVTLIDLVVNGVDLASNETIGVGGSRTYTGSIAACTADQGYAYDTNIYFQDSKTSANFNVTGDGNQLEGTCAK